MRGNWLINQRKVLSVECHFCSKECGLKYLEEKENKLKDKVKKEQEELSQPCSQCGGSLGDTYYYDRTGERQGKFCSQTCFQKVYKDKLEKIKKQDYKIKI